jgi:hypothetical protein
VAQLLYFILQCLQVLFFAKKIQTYKLIATIFKTKNQIFASFDFLQGNFGPAKPSVGLPYVLSWPCFFHFWSLQKVTKDKIA